MSLRPVTLLLYLYSRLLTSLLPITTRLLHGASSSTSYHCSLTLFSYRTGSSHWTFTSSAALTGLPLSRLDPLRTPNPTLRRTSLPPIERVPRTLTFLSSARACLEAFRSTFSTLVRAGRRHERLSPEGCKLPCSLYRSTSRATHNHTAPRTTNIIVTALRFQLPYRSLLTNLARAALSSERVKRVQEQEGFLWHRVPLSWLSNPLACQFSPRNTFILANNSCRPSSYLFERIC